MKITTPTILSILLVLFFAGCKKEKLGPEEIKPLVGRWNLEAVEFKGPIKQWEPLPATQSDAFQIRYDGVVLTKDGLGTCCGPKSLTLNQKVFSIKPKEAIPRNPQCDLIDCLGCETFELELKNDTLIASSCFGSGRRRFVRG